MKRILVGGILCAVSIFFIGCSSDTPTSAENKEAALQALTQTLAWEEDRLTYNITPGESAIPDYTEINDENKYMNLNGEKAFHIAEAHSAEKKDIYDFDIITMLSNGTFLYGYSTREKESTVTTTAATTKTDETAAVDDRDYIHCVALYNFDNKQFKVIHENTFSRSDVLEENESFYMQLCTPSDSAEQQLFVYDNGKGYLYTITESLVQSTSDIEPGFATDIEGSVRSFFQNAVSASVTNAMTDGAGRFYVELALEKKEVKLDEGPGEVGVSVSLENVEVNTEENEKELEKEAEEAEKEIQDSTVELVLIYDFTTLQSGTTLNQINLNHEKQKAEWIAKTQNKTYTSASDVPNAEKDWEEVLKKIPNDWSIGFTGNISRDKKATDWLDKQGFSYSTLIDGGLPVLQWNGSGTEKRSFNYKDSAEPKPIQCTFEPTKGTYLGFKSLTENTVLPDVFLPLNGSYYELYGKTGSYENYAPVTIERTYKIESTDAENKTTTETETQTLTVYEKRKTTLSSPVQNGGNAYLEGYKILDAGYTLYAVANNQVLCLKDDNKLYWLNQDETTTPVGDITITDGAAIDLAQDGTTLYYLISTDENFIVREEKEDQSISTWTIENELLNAEIINPKRETEESDHLYLEAFEEHSKSPDTWESIHGNQFQKTTIQKNQELLDSLKKEGVDISQCTVNGEGFLLTTFQKGLLFFDLQKEQDAAAQTVVLSGGTWYGTWKKGNQFVSVGFPSETTSYTTLDAVNAIVYEYTLDELYKKSLQALLDKAKPAETVSSTEETQENYLGDRNDMQDSWKRKKEASPANIEPLNKMLDEINK